MTASSDGRMIHMYRKDTSESDALQCTKGTDTLTSPLLRSRYIISFEGLFVKKVFLKKQNKKLHNKCVLLGGTHLCTYRRAWLSRYDAAGEVSTQVLRLRIGSLCLGQAPTKQCILSRTFAPSGDAFLQICGRTQLFTHKKWKGSHMMTVVREFYLIGPRDRSDVEETEYYFYF
jgi:hypothetical protein